MSKDLKAVKDSLGQPGAAARAAKLILDFLKNQLTQDPLIF
jgi:dTDP-4-dehydrorhamnose reductase